MLALVLFLSSYFFLFSMEQKVEISKSIADPPLTHGNTHCSGDAEEKLVGCESSYLSQDVSTASGASCEEPTAELPTFQGNPAGGLQASVEMPGPFLDLICS